MTITLASWTDASAIFLHKLRINVDAFNGTNERGKVRERSREALIVKTEHRTAIPVRL